MTAKASLTVSLDAMGGDHAPDMVIEGADRARVRLDNVRFLLFGDQARIAPLLDRFPALKACSEIRHTTGSVAMDAKPSVALRQGRDSSMRLAINAVKDGQADCVVSAGNTGALMAMAKFVLKTLPGIDRPAICSFFPTVRGESAMLDLGANAECSAENLEQFALMGSIFARIVLGVMQPTVGLLNIGAEELKGSPAVQEAAERLKATSWPIHYHGFIEGDDITAGTTDVVVTDGFTGNVALKTAEGMAKMMYKFARQSFSSSLLAKLGALLAAPALHKLRDRTDPRKYNGGVFLGLRGVCVKSHGGTDALGFANAVGVAADLVSHRFVERVTEELAEVAGANADPAAEAAAG